MQVRARHYRTGHPLDIVCEQDKIARISVPDKPAADLPWVAPAFCDVQINGCDQISFNSDTLTREQIRHVVAVCRRHGIAQFCPTLVTGSFEAFMHGLRTIREACDEDPNLAQAIVGIHQEGPYISPEDGPRGAHPKQHVRPPCWDEFQRFQNEAAHGMIKMLTLAPETAGALPFIEKVATSGVIVALGHTGASGACIRDAVRAGARISTHLGNGSHAMLPRHENYIWEQLAADGLWASMIADGHHLPDSVMRCILRVKTPARLILTCDASPLAGAPPGKYRQWEYDFEVLPVGKIVVSGTSYLGGSWAFTDLCVANVLKLGETSLADTIDMASNRPRELLGLPARHIEVGEPAELILFDWSPECDFQLKGAIVGDREIRA
jgi:N-acetylglucosamine-6-phosphate deacetylase